MKRICTQCQTEMIEDLAIDIQYGMYGIRITKKGKGLFNGVSAKPKAAVCPNCGYIVLYTDEYNVFVN